MTDHPRNPAPRVAPCAPQEREPATEPSYPAEADTGRDSAPALLSRIARLHRALAEAVEDLSKHAEIRLAAGGDLSVMDDAVSSPEPDAPSKLLTVADLAHMLQVNERTVRGWRDEGRLPEPIEIGGTVRWHPVVLDEWLRGGGR